MLDTVWPHLTALAEALNMERIWLKSYLPGMATDIDPSACAR